MRLSKLAKLKAKATQLGYTVSKKIIYEKLHLCPNCQSKSILQQITIREKYYQCTKCGYKTKPAKYKYQAIQNWNNEVPYEKN